MNSYIRSVITDSSPSSRSLMHSEPLLNVNIYRNFGLKIQFTSEQDAWCRWLNGSETDFRWLSTRGRVIKRQSETIRTVFLTIYLLFSKCKKHDFLRFFELLHTFSRTLHRNTVTNKHGKHQAPQNSNAFRKLQLALHLFTVHRYPRYRAPRYVADWCFQVSEVSARQHLRSVSRRKLNIPRFRRSTFGTRAFSVAGSDSLEVTAWFVAWSGRRVKTFQVGLENASLCRIQKHECITPSRHRYKSRYIYLLSYRTVTY